MATISELMEGKTPGSVKVRLPYWEETEHFIPYFCSAHGWWYGLNQHRHACDYPDPGDWTLYTEPKRKVAMYLWAVCKPLMDPFQTKNYYTTEDRKLVP